jgi:hypothetical protein
MLSASGIFYCQTGNSLPVQLTSEGGEPTTKRKRKRGTCRHGKLEVVIFL